MARNPKYQKIHGLILSRKPLREADLLLTVFTKEQGKLRVLARSARKAQSKLGSKLQQLYHVELYLAGSGIWPIVTSAVVLGKYPRLRNSLSALSLAFYAAELTMKLTPDQEPNPKVYDLLQRLFEEINHQAKNLEFNQKDKVWPSVIEKFRLDLLAALGHGVSTRFCAHCGIKIAPGTPAAFSGFAGGVVHKECGASFPDIRPLSEVSAGQLALLDEQALEDVAELNVSEEAHRSLSNFIAFILERDLQSEKFIDQVKEQE